jgi:SAM-dependent methyltransferase
MGSWDKFYSKDISWQVFLDKLSDHKYYLQKILELNPKKVLEVGCGPGVRCIFLSYLGIDVTALDNDEGIIEQIKFYTKNLRGKNKIENGDAFNLSYSEKEFDVIFNAGFLEHFEDLEKIQLVKEFTRVAEYYIFMVPNKAHRLRPYGNEDLKTKEEWDSLLKDFNLIESKDINKYWSNNKIRRLLEVVLLFFKVDIREKQMYYAKVKAK